VLTAPDPPSSILDRVRAAPRLWKWLAGMALAFALLRIGMPAALVWGIEWAAQSQAGARLEVTDVSLSVLSGELTLLGVTVAQPDADPARPIDPETALLQLARVHLGIEWFDLLVGKINIPLLVIESPTARVAQRPDGSLAIPAPPADESIGAESVAPQPEIPEETVVAPSEEAQRVESSAATDPAAVVEVAEGTPAEPPATAVSPSEPSEAPALGWDIAVDRFELSDADFRVSRQSTGEVVAEFAADHFGLESLRVESGATSLGGIALERPVMKMQRDWAMNLGGGDDAADADPADASEPIPLRLAQIDVSSGGFTLQTPRGPLAASIRLAASDIGIDADHRFPVDVGVKLGEGRVELKGQVGLNPLYYEGQFNWTALAVPPFLLLNFPEVVPWLNSCDADGAFQVSFRSSPGDGPLGVTARGTSTVSSVSFKDPDSGELALEWKQLQVDARRIFVPIDPDGAPATEPILVEFASARLETPNIRYTNPPDALGRLTAALGALPPEPPAPEAAEEAGEETSEPPEVAADDEAPAPGGPAMLLTTDRLEIVDGTLHYVDRTVSPTHETQINGLAAKFGNLQLAPPSAQTIDMRGLIQKTGTFRLTGGLPGGRGRLQFDLKALDLVSYDSLARNAGWAVHSGSSTLKSEIRIGSNSYEADNRLVLHDFSVQPNEQGGFSATFGVSLDLALALLRDPFGDITLTIPVAMKRDEVGLGMGSIVLSALRSALMGALTSPFKLVGALLPDGGGPPSFDAVAFQPGSDALPADHADRVEPLAKLLNDRPGLALALNGQWAEADTPAVALQILTEKAQSGGDFPDVEGGSFFARRRVAGALRERADGGVGALEPADEQLLQAYIAAQPVEAARLASLAQARAEALLGAFAAVGVPPDAVSMDGPASGDVAGVALGLGPRPLQGGDPEPAP
jgi:hypothetical protein